MIACGILRITNIAMFLDKFKQMLESKFCNLYEMMGKKTKKQMENIVFKKNIKNRKIDKYKRRSLNVALIYLT